MEQEELALLEKESEELEDANSEAGAEDYGVEGGRR